jgi:hypothetical protein
MAAVITLECACCGKTFLRPAKQFKADKSKAVFCGRTCFLKQKKRAQWDFWSFVDKKGEDECWPWKGGIDSNGYGYFEENDKHVISHRRAYELTNGPIPKGEGYHGTVIRHTCDSPSCNNPSHLIPGTHQDNMVDMISRRRTKLKLTEDQVRAIREDARPYGEICKEYGISRPTVSNIKWRTTWKHVQ